MKKFNIFIIIACVFMLCGCAVWQLVPDNYQWRSADFAVVLPQGWMKFRSPTALLFLTKDGELLQNISLYREKIGKELLISKKKFAKEMLSQELSETLVNELSLDQKKHNFKVIENIPVKLGGRDAFRVTYSFNTADNLKLKTVIYGFIKDKFVYFIQYEAAEQHYFDKDIAAFDKFIQGFQILR